MNNKLKALTYNQCELLLTGLYQLRHVRMPATMEVKDDMEYLLSQLQFIKDSLDKERENYEN